MIPIKQPHEIETMRRAGILLAEVFDVIAPLIVPGVSSLHIDQIIERELVKRELKGESKGFQGYQHVSCISFNDEVVHAIPSAHKIVAVGDMVKIDVCASWCGYCADMARTFFVGQPEDRIAHFVKTAHQALDAGICQARVGKRVSDISAAVQRSVEQQGFSVIRDFAGHGIGKMMHEEPEITNFVTSAKGAVLAEGMTLAIEPMISMGRYEVFIAQDGWTVKMRDKSLAAHVEDTVLVTREGPEILTRPAGRSFGI